MGHNRRLLAVTLAALMVLSVFTPGALAATTAQAGNTTVAVDTDAATDVTAESATLNGNVTELNGSENATVAFQYWTADDPDDKTTVEVGDLTVEGEFSADLENLSANTTYVYVATAEAGNASTVGAEETFTTLETLDVSVETGEPTNVTATNATFQGNLTDVSGAENATISFRYYEQGQRNTTNVLTLGEQSEGEFAADVSGLSPNTTYVVVAGAEAERGDESADATGASVNVTTAEAVDPLGVETANASDVTTDSATLNGELVGLGDAENASVSFEYWVAGDSENSSNTTAVELDSAGSFSAAVEDLSANTTYVYVAQAEAGDDTVTGNQSEFTTAAEAAPLGVETANASDVTNASATLNGELTGLADAENASVSFEYWVSGDRANSTNTTAVELDSAGSFSAALEGLSGNTTYVYVAQAEANGSTVTGEQVEFTTQPDLLPLDVETADATDVTDDSATLNGDLTGLNGSDSANVSFTYWVEGDEGNATSVDAGSLGEAGDFDAGLSDLANDTTYVYVAEAEADGSTVTGDEVTFTTAENATEEDEEFEAPEGPFGQQVTAFIDYLREETDRTGREFGQAVASFARENNPGADNRPDHAGPPWADDDDEDGAETEDDDKRRGPPGDKERGPPEDKERGPPEDRGPDRGDDDGDDDEDEEDEEDEDEEEDDDKRRGPPDDRGPNR